MNYAKIITADIADGPGFRVSMFCTGCEHHCKGCFNEHIWSPSVGKKFDDDAKERIFKELRKPWVRGFTFLGGEPLSSLSDNRATTISFAKELKEKFPDKDIVLFSGYTFEEISSSDDMKEILDYIDTLVDGRFVEEK